MDGGATYVVVNIEAVGAELIAAQDAQLAHVVGDDPGRRIGDRYAVNWRRQ